jgi:hypothetical protein
MKSILALLFITILIITVGCTDNQRARKWGGTENINLETGERVLNVTWKQDDLWILTKQEPTKPPTTYEFREKSSFGIMEGKIVINEK